MTHEEQVEIISRLLENGKIALSFAEEALERYRIDETDDMARHELLKTMRQFEALGFSGKHTVEAYSWDDEKDD